MKHKPNVYAKALAEIMVAKKDNGKIVNNFLKLLEKNGDLKKAKQIVSLAEKLYLQKIGRNKIILETARKINHKEISSKVFKEKDIVQEKINPELIAGIKIIVNNEKQLDFSLKKKLEEIFNNN